MKVDPMSPSALQICFDRILPEDKQREAAEYAVAANPDNLPEGEDLDAIAEPFLAVDIGKKWGMPADGSPVVITCRFLGGTPGVQGNVINYARRIEQHAHVRFDFIASGSAHIRIGFTPGGSWSFIGTDCNFVAQNQPTMNFGWFNANTSQQDYSSTVQHEFLHALGAIHEHQSPGATIRWNEPVVYQVYGGPPNNWDQATIKANVIDKYGQAGIANTEFDPKSIMLYAIDPKLTLDGFGTQWNTDLSVRDQAFLAVQYPKPGGPVEPPPDPVEPPPGPQYRTLPVGGPPVAGDLRAVDPEVFALVASGGKLIIAAHRIGLPGNVQIEMHRDTYPTTKPLRGTNAIKGPIRAGNFYVTVMPMRASQARGRFSLVCRRG